MEWIKIKTRHIFHEGFNKSTMWAWVRLMALVAELESMPTEKQMLSVITKNELKLLSNHFESVGKVVSSVLEKVLEDVFKVKSERNRLKQYRASIGSKDESRTRTVHSSERSGVHVRVEKSREEKSIKDNINNSTAEAVAKATTPQADFVNQFSKIYNAKTGQMFKAGKEDYILIANMLKQFGLEVVASKLRTLSELCENQSVWFTKDGFSSFTIKKLSQFWNEIIPKESEAEKSDRIVSEMVAERMRERNERA